MIDTLSADVIRALSGHRSKGSVSIYVRTHRSGPDTRQDPIQLKNQLKEAREKMAALDLNGDTIEAILAPAKELLENETFWKHQDSGLAVFLAPDFQQQYRAPCSFQNLTVVGSRFHLKPLLPWITEDGKFYLLTLSKNNVRFFEGSRDFLTEKEVKDVPKSLAEALKYDDPEVSLQHHPGGAEKSGGREPIYHGQGSGKDDENDRLLRFFQKIDRGLHSVLREQKAPLILAGVEHYFPIYADANRYQPLMKDGIHGNPDGLSTLELHDAAWKRVHPHLQSHQEQAKEKIQQALSHGQASLKVQEVALAAGQGRVDTLFVAIGEQQWGRIDLEQNQVESDYDGPEMEDILDYAAVQTFLHGGQVHVVDRREVPEGALVAGLYRY